MLSARLIRQFKLSRMRQLHSTSMKGNKSVSNESNDPLPKSKTPDVPDNSVLGTPMHNVSEFDKRILAWVKIYPSKDQVPARVSMDCIQRAHTKARIRLCNIMVVLSIIGFIASSMSGKREVASGKNILTERLKWMKEQQDKGKAEAEAAAAAAAAGK